MSSVNLNLLRALSREDKIVRRWLSDDFSGRKLTFLNGNVDGEYHEIVHGDDDNIIKTASVSIFDDNILQTYMKIHRIINVEDGIKKISKNYIDRFIIEEQCVKNIPVLKPNGNVDFQPVEVVCSWITHKPGNGWLKIDKKVELLKVPSPPKQADLNIQQASILYAQIALAVTRSKRYIKPDAETINDLKELKGMIPLDSSLEGFLDQNNGLPRQLDKISKFISDTFGQCSDPRPSSSSALQAQQQSCMQEAIRVKNTVKRVVWKKNAIFKWRISEGKVQKILSKQNVLCHFPLANPIFLHDLSSPVVWPRMLEKTKTDFLEDHLLTHIKENPRVTEIFFDARYLSKKSKFNPSKRVTPYEWGVTLISYARHKESSVQGFGHSALVIEKIKDGWHYHAEQAHVTTWSKLEQKTALDLGLREASGGGAVRLNEAGSSIWGKGFQSLKKYNTDCYGKYLTYSKTWIRKRECVEKILSAASRQIRSQTISNPAVYLNDFGREAVISEFFYDIVSSVPPRRGVNEFGFQEEKENKSDKKHNCVTWAVDMLQKADIDVDTGSLKKLFVSLPKDYGNHSLSTINHDDHPISRTKLTKILNSAIKNSDDALRQIFVTGVFFSRNYFVASGNLPEGKIREAYTLIDDQFLGASNNISYLKYDTRCLFADNQPTGLGFGNEELFNFLDPLMDRLIPTISRSFISDMLWKYNAHLTIKPPREWEDKEACLVRPKTYSETIQAILSNYLKKALSEEMLKYMDYPTNHLTVI